jgi:hypothetical protein
VRVRRGAKLNNGGAEHFFLFCFVGVGVDFEAARFKKLPRFEKKDADDAGKKTKKNTRMF